MGNWCCPFYKIIGMNEPDSFIATNSYKFKKKDRNIFRDIDSPDNFILYGTCKSKVPDSYFSPHCRKRPYHAQRICNNCSKIFYSYKEAFFCSKDCKYSFTPLYI